MAVGVINSTVRKAEDPKKVRLLFFFVCTRVRACIGGVVDGWGHQLAFIYAPFPLPTRVAAAAAAARLHWGLFPTDLRNN